MFSILRAVVLPATIILGAVWLLVLHKRSTLVPFLISIAVLVLVLTLLGLEPLGFFVSYGGYALFAIVSLLVALVVRGVGAQSVADLARIKTNQVNSVTA
jgi:hypothetical protein